MKEREVKDNNKTTWKCVQAFTGSNGEAAKEAEEITSMDGEVTVICTPSGGAQTIRLELSHDWVESVSDHELISKIENSLDKS